MEEKILLEQIFNLFMQNGIKSMTMDDIAKELSVSKKTLYKYFKDKADLVSRAMQFHIEDDIKMMEGLAHVDGNAIDQMFAISKHVTEHIKEIHPSNLYDLQKYYPDAWSLFTQHKFTNIYKCLVNNMERGIKEGIYRENLNVEVIARIYIGRMDMCLDNNLFPVNQFKFRDIIVEMIRYHIRGIANEKGIKYLDKKFRNNNLI